MSDPKNRQEDYENEECLDKTFYRMSRYLSVNGDWFFMSREGEQVGPFVTKAAAVEGAGRYIEQMKLTENQGVGQAEQVAKYGTWKFTNYR